MARRDTVFHYMLNVLYVRTSLMKHELSYGKERATKFAVLYAIKICKYQLVNAGLQMRYIF